VNISEIVEQLKVDEGFTRFSFWDDAKGGGDGHWTWGYGTKAPGRGWEITKEAATEELKVCVVEAVKDYYKIFPPEGATTLEINEVRQQALVNMIYNLGYSRFVKFQKTIAAILNGEWQKAANQARRSLWYTQVPRRAERICRELESGEKGT
jgi:GH24 family phage-related lysozyme (muramidase)